MKVPISVIIIAKNEEKQLHECMKNVCDWVDEIVLVDDESTDSTVQIAKEYTDKVFTRKMELEGKQRNFGASKAKNEWVMILDCDERVTEGIKKEIEEILKSGDEKTVAYWAPQICYIGKYHLKHGGWANPHIRLYKKDFLTWREVAHDVVHPGLDIKPGYTHANLKESLIHYNFANVEDFIRKVNRQSSLEAIKWHLSGKKIGLGKAVWRMIDRFFRRFIGKGGHKDGYYGFVGAVCSSLYEFGAYSKLREIREYGAYLEQYGIKEKKQEEALKK